MAFSSWLRGLRSRLEVVPHHRAAKGRAKGLRRRRPHVETLEDRTLPSTVSWINPSGGDWDTAANWRDGTTGTNHVPGASDDAVINTAGITVTHSSAAADPVHSLSSQAAIALSGGSLSLAATSSVGNNLTLSGGTLTGSGNVTVSGQFTATGGGSALNGSGTVYLNGPSSISGLALTRPLVNSGYLTLAGAVYLGPSLVFTNTASGTVELRGGSWLGDPDVSPFATFANQGSLLATQGGRNLVFAAFNNAAGGTVRVSDNGFLGFARGGTEDGTPGVTTFLGDPGTTLAFYGLTLGRNTSVSADAVDFINAPTTVAGDYHAALSSLEDASASFTGRVDVAGSSLTLTRATADFTGATLVRPLDLHDVALNGTLLSSADIHVAGTLTGGGTLGGSGTVYLDGPSQVSITLNRPLVNNGYMTVAGISPGAGVVITNSAAGTVELQPGAGIADAFPRAVFNNQGTLLASGDGYHSVSVVFNNAAGGIVRVGDGGTLALIRGGTEDGAFLGDAGTTLRFISQKFGPGSSIDGATVTFESYVDGPVTVAGSYHAAALTQVDGEAHFTGGVDVAGADLTVLNGLADFAGAALVRPLDLHDVALNGTLLSSADIHVAGTLTGASGTLGGSGTVYLDGGSADTPNFVWATLTLNRNLVNNGYTIAPSFLDMAAPVTLTSAGTFEVRDSSWVGTPYTDRPASFVNQGTVLMTSTGSAAATAVVYASLSNGGMVDVRSGTLNLARGYVQTGGSTILDGGSLAGALNIQSGALQGTGTISGSVSNGGQISFASPAGRIIVSGDYTQTASGSLLAKIGGRNAGAQYDQLEVGGNLTLAGNLLVSVTDGFVALVTDTFTVVKNDPSRAIAGTFAGLPEGALVTADTGDQFQVSYLGGAGHHDLTLHYTNVPPVPDAGGPYSITEGDSLTLDASKSSDPDGDTLTYSWTINGHANAAAGISPTLTWAQLQALGVSEGPAVAVSVQVDDGRGNVRTASTTLTVADAPLTATDQTLTLTEGQTLSSALVATFTDPGPDAAPGNYRVGITWDDGGGRSHTTGGVIQPVTPGSSTFGVYAGNTYTEEGTYGITVTITDVGGSSATANSSAVVADAPLSPVTQFALPRANSNPWDITAGRDGNVWFTENGGTGGNRIGRITPAGVLTEFALPAGSSSPFGIVAGPDGNLWFTESSKIGRITPTGTLTEFAAPAGARYLRGITVGPDNNLWFTESWQNTSAQGVGIGRITLNGVATDFHLPPDHGTPDRITAGADGNLWFTDYDQVGRIAPDGTGLTFFALQAGSQPTGITKGPDGNVWFTEWSRIGRITPAGALTEFPVTAGSGPNALTAGPDGNLWFTEYSGNGIGRITPAGAVSEFPQPGGGPPSHSLLGIAAGPDGNLWFTDSFGNSVSRWTLHLAPVRATEGQPLMVTLASFTDPDPYDLARDYSVSIDWGDGTTWTGVVTANGHGGFDITGAQPYAEEQATPYAITVTVTDAGGSTLTLGGTATVADAPLSPGTEFALPTAGSMPWSITTGPDNNLWFTELDGNRIGRITPAGAVTEYPLPNANSQPTRITAGLDGNLWFTERYSNRIGRITPAGAVREYTLPNANSYLEGITAGPDGNLWFTEYNQDRIGRITPDGTLTEFPLNDFQAGPYGIAPGPDNNLWFTELFGNRIGRITPAGAITEFPLPSADSRPNRITADRSGNLWFTETAGRIGRITAAKPNTITEFNLPPQASEPQDITLGPDGNLWVPDLAGDVVRVTPTGGLAFFALPPVYGEGITVGPDGNLWIANPFGGRPPNPSSTNPGSIDRFALHGNPVSATAGQPFTAALASFTDLNPSAAPDDYTVSIDWGDGTPPDTTSGSVTPNAQGGFDVTGGHTYDQAGTTPYSVTVQDAGGSTFTLTGTATVGGAAASATGPGGGAPGSPGGTGTPPARGTAVPSGANLTAASGSAGPAGRTPPAGTAVPAPTPSLLVLAGASAGGTGAGGGSPFAGTGADRPGSSSTGLAPTGTSYDRQLAALIAILAEAGGIDFADPAPVNGLLGPVAVAAPGALNPLVGDPTALEWFFAGGPDAVT